MGSYGTGTAAWSRAINNHLAANSIHSQLNISAETLEGPEANIRSRSPELPPLFTHPFFSMFFFYARVCCLFFLFFFLFWQAVLNIFRLKIWHAGVFPASRHNNDKHKWAALNGYLQQGVCDWLRVLAPFPHPFVFT